MSDPFADMNLEEDIWDGAATVRRPDPTEVAPLPGTALFKERCAKCGGTGRWGTYRPGACFACNGKGYREYRTDPATRAKARTSSAQSRQRKAAAIDASAIQWLEAHPAEAAWLKARAGSFDFASSMLEALDRYGRLTDKQAAVVTRLAEADKVRREGWAAEKAAREAAAPAITIEKIEEAFAHARSLGKKSLRLRLDTFIFSPASAHSKNAGALYVKEGEAYLGKIVGGKFLKVRECDDATEARVLAAAADPENAAIAYGKRFGVCSCCGAELTDPKSIERGIGPVCASKYGW